MLFASHTDSYNYFYNRVPPTKSNLKLIVVHSHSDIRCDRWTTRIRDVRRKRAQKLNFDCCIGYLVEPKTYTNIQEAYANSLESVMFVGYRLYDNSWIEVVDRITFSSLSWIEAD